MLMSAMGKKFKCRMARYDMDANFILHSIIGGFFGRGWGWGRLCIFEKGIVVAKY